MWRWKLANWILKDDLRKRLAYIKYTAEKNLSRDRTENQIKAGFHSILKDVAVLHTYAERR